MKSICIIGAGNIGSRHLQGIKKVKFPLSIEVVDPSIKSIKVARERYNEVLSSTIHKISYLKNLDEVSKEIDLAIIATSSDIRRKVTEKLLATSSVKFLLLEKILFQKKEDYRAIGELLKKKGCKAWVNFSMRTMPFYHNLKGKLKGNIQMAVSGSQYGLITNIIHYVDYISFLTNCNNFKISTSGLDSQPIASKRQGFLELNGTLDVYFENGSNGSFTCFPDGDAPYMIEVFSKNYRCISKENEGIAQISSFPTWNWQKVDSNIPYQSDMTNIVAQEILTKGICHLTRYTQASDLHLQLFEGLLKFLNGSNAKKFNLYPFT
ncbi:MAG: Gfo/Idh/MocA family oxidoreductase [Candidatus Daviesbacteria bacterium]|nr:Gfo/Idh/MocA family oxidoreductase [Candidatus Daviesbacteria bacterium]